MRLMQKVNVFILFVAGFWTAVFLAIFLMMWYFP